MECDAFVCCSFLPLSILKDRNTDTHVVFKDGFVVNVLQMLSAGLCRAIVCCTRGVVVLELM